MNKKIEAAMRALDAAKQIISQIKDRLPENDPHMPDMDDAEMGVAWIKQRLRRVQQAATLKQATTK
jgi:hypothetical protein